MHGFHDAVRDWDLVEVVFVWSNAGLVGRLAGGFVFENVDVRLRAGHLDGRTSSRLLRRL